MNTGPLIAACTCRAVSLEAIGPPIIGVICYCDDCQAAAAQIESLAGAPAFRLADGGTPFVSYRKDRVRWVRGEERLQKLKLRPDSATNRWVAACCNSVLLLNFDDAKHWVAVVRARVTTSTEEPQLRMCMKFAQKGVAQSAGPPAYAGYPPRLVFRLIAARIAMLFS